jgi:hypothetical protein
LQIEDRIALFLGTDVAKLQVAIAAHRDYIAAETLTTEWATTNDGAATIGQIEGQPLTISVRKVSE